MQCISTRFKRTFLDPCPTRGEKGHRRCRAAVGPTSHGVREGREGAARHRVAISTSGEHRVAAAEGASRGENRPFRPLRAHRRRADADLDVSHRDHEVADRMNVPLGIGSRREPRGAAPLSQARYASRRSGRSRSRATRSTVLDAWRRRDRRIAIDPAVMHACFTHTCLFRQVRANFNRTPVTR